MRVIQPPRIISTVLPRYGTRTGSCASHRLGMPRNVRGSAPVLAAGAAVSLLARPVFGSIVYARHPFPSWIDAISGIGYALVLLGVILLTRHDRPLASRLRIMLDALLSTIVLGSFMWYFLVGPALLHSLLPPGAKLVGSGYVIADMALLLCVFPLWSDLRDSILRPTVGFLSAGLIIGIVGNCANTYYRFHQIHAGLFVHGLEVGSDLLIGLAALLAAVALSHAGEQPEAAWGDVEPRQPDVDSPSLVGALLPYTMAPAIGGLVVRAASEPGPLTLVQGVYVGAGLLVLILFLRQIVAAVEHMQLYQDVIEYAESVRRLNAELRSTQTELWGKQRDLQDNNRVLQMANQRLQALATSDPLTGLANHRSMIGLLDAEVERAARYGHSFAVVFIDLDHFKALNDSFGHPVGDAALREFAGVVRGALRGPDILCRWGGEEFVALLPETSTEGALEVAERVRAAVAGHAFTSAGRVHTTCSCGVSVFPIDATDRDGMIAMADRAMYASKRLGRNQVRAASDPAVLALWAHATEAGVRGEGALVETVEALAGLVDARDHCTGEHVDTVAALAVRLALALGVDTSEAHMIGLAARLHDIGKVAIPDAILRKPGSLDDEEATLMRTHPTVGASVIARVASLSALAPIIRGHHEWWNGGGYPDGLSGEAIPLGARIVTVADAYKAMTGDRPYRRGCSPSVALNEVRRCAGTQFDPVVVARFESVLWPNPLVAERIIASENRLARALTVPGGTELASTTAV